MFSFASFSKLSRQSLPFLLLGLFTLPACASQKSSGSGLLDSELYRGELLRVESVLYQKRPSREGDVARLAEACRDLSRLLRQRGRESAAVEVLQFAQAASTGLGVGNSPLDLPRHRRSWEGLRSRWFRPVSWFGRSTPQLEVLQEGS